MQLLGTNVIASNIDDNVVTLDPKNENIVVKYSDGSEEIISPNFDVTMRTSSVNERQYAPYIPDGLDVEGEFAQSASNSTRMATLQGRIPNNLQIDQPLGYSQGYLGFHGCSAQENYKSDMILSGYPNDINYSSTKQEKSIGSFYTVNANSMRYRIFCVSGMSGGPIFDTQYSVYAIHSYSTSSSLYNGGGYMFGDYLFNMIADAVTDSIERWN